MAQFSVLIPVYNGANFLAEALQSIADQTLEGVQVVVSDNASTDGTAEILQNWQDRLNLRVITQPAVLPMQAHFNAILDAVETEFYMLLCHDDYLADPDALRLAQDALVATPDAAAVYCDLVYVNPRRKKLAQRTFRRGTHFSADEAGKRTIETARNQFGIPIGVRRSSLGDLRYDPQFHYAMDVDLSWAIARHQDALHIPKPLIANRYGNTNMTWALLSKALDEYLALANKYDINMNITDHIRLRGVNFFVAQQKRLFSLYQGFISWRG
ncbi:glycosyltransferase family 2 protein [Loktanella sp. S4079]|uniref:glycosyltransferase family 2 protein n=1 Tax=Loktanella sp. S4079 TaxID=579483 RepID=UPI000697A6B7|nr:glycosyltransferase [Loktanella sp. S4079]